MTGKDKPEKAKVPGKEQSFKIPGKESSSKTSGKESTKGTPSGKSKSSASSTVSSGSEEIRTEGQQNVARSNILPLESGITVGSNPYSYDGLPLSSTGLTRSDVTNMLNDKFTDFEKKILSILGKPQSNTQSCELPHVSREDSPLNVHAEDDGCSYLGEDSPERRSWFNERGGSFSRSLNTSGSVSLDCDDDTRSNFDEFDKELVPKSWDDLISNVQNIMNLEIKEDVAPDRASYLAQSFVGLPMSKKKSEGPCLPAEGIIINSWKDVSKSLPKLVSFKQRHRYQYRWPDDDFNKFGKVPEVDPCVSTYINANKGFGGDKGPRDLYSSEKKLNSSLSAIDQSLRFQQRAVSHASFLLASLSKGLKGEVEVSDESVSQLLGGLANTIVDIADLSVRASARCVLSRRNIHIDALNIPDSSAKSELLKVPLEGDQMFGGKVQDITHKSSEMIRDVRETSKAYGLSQKRSFDKVESSNKAGQEKKFKRLDSGSKQSHNKPGSGSSTYYNRSSGQDGNRNNSGWGNQSQGYKQHQHNQRFQKKGKY